MTAIQGQLQTAQRQHQLVEVYGFNDPEMFDIGYVVGIDDEFVLLLGHDWDGKINGLTAMRLSRITKVVVDDDYLITLKYKADVAREYDYYDRWGLTKQAATTDYVTGGIFSQLLNQVFNQQQALVIGTNQYNGSDEFQGFITELNAWSLTMHYFNSHDLSSVWEYRVPLEEIEYLRCFGYQAAQTERIFERVFHLPKGVMKNEE